MAADRVPEIYCCLLAVVIIFVDHPDDGAGVLWSIEMGQGWRFVRIGFLGVLDTELKVGNKPFHLCGDGGMLWLPHLAPDPEKRLLRHGLRLVDAVAQSNGLVDSAFLM